MARKGVGDWTPAPKKYRPTRQPGFKFETLKKARKMDAERSNIINEQIKGPSYRALINRLVQPKRHPRNMASARYVGTRRIAFNSQLSQLIATQRQAISFCTLIPKGWLIHADNLKDVDPAKLLEQIRGVISRVDIGKGEGKANGWFALALDMEYIEHLDSHSFHLHGILAGEMTKVFAALRHQPKFKACADHPDIGKRPIQIKRVKDGTEARTINYLIKTYFGMRTYAEKGGKMERLKKRIAIPDGPQAELLAWLSKFTINDFILTKGIYFGKKSLHISKKSVHLPKERTP